MEQNIKYIKVMLFILTAIFAIVVFEELAFLIVPILMSLFIIGLVIPFFNFFKKLKVPILISFLFLLSFLFGVVKVTTFVIKETKKEYVHKQDEIHQLFERKFVPIMSEVEESIGVKFENEIDWNQAINLATPKGIVNSVSPALKMLNSFVGLVLMTMIYTLIMLWGVYKHEEYLKYIGGEKLYKLVDKCISDLAVYLKVKTIISIITASMFGITCYLFGVDFALFFAFLAFGLNFIPQLGSILATIFPAFLGFLQIDSLMMASIFVLILVGIQLLMGSVIEVKFIGRSFAINTVIVFINLLFWGYLWGIVGVILSVPIIILIKNVAVVYAPNGVMARMFSSQ
jgi:AI-2 transport protein TqsA